MDFHVNMTKNVRRLQHTQAIKTLFEDESMSDMSSTDVKIMQDQLDVQTPKQLMLRPKDRRHRVATNVFRNLSGICNIFLLHARAIIYLFQEEYQHPIHY